MRERSALIYLLLLPIDINIYVYCSRELDDDVGVHQWRGDGGSPGPDRPAVHVRAGRDAGPLHQRHPPRQRVWNPHAESADGRELLLG